MKRNEEMGRVSEEVKLVRLRELRDQQAVIDKLTKDLELQHYAYDQLAQAVRSSLFFTTYQERNNQEKKEVRP